MLELEDNDLRLAVLIDSDNVPYSYVREMMEEIARYGTPTLKRIYGDWTKPTVSGWKSCLLENAITPIQQYSYTQGKNATDSAMIIDAMDILYTGAVDGFCIVSSDSDFTRLCMRLREAGMKVIGIGEKKTPTPFIAACDKFIYLEILKPTVKRRRPTGKQEEPASEVEPQKSTRKPLPKKLIKLISTSIDDLADDDGWAYLGEVGTLISKKQPDFDSRSYGYQKLSGLVKNCDSFETDLRGNTRRKMSIYVRVKP